MLDAWRPPRADEVEVSLFGAGIGECVVAHIGNNRWLIVDSCVNRDTGRPVALEYLQQLEVEIGRHVCLVVASHWHDDHVKGLATVLRAAASARFACSNALTSPEFWTLVASTDHPMSRSGSGLDEFRKIMGLLQERLAGTDRRQSLGPTWSVANTILCQQHGGPETGAAEIQALSPASGVSTLSFRDIACDLLKEGAPKRRVVSLGPNETSVVLWVQVGSIRVLLGGDLEEGTGTQSGWRAIVESPCRPSGKANVFKVPHHGSPDAHCERVLREVTRDRRIPEDRMGQVRLRMPASDHDSVSVELVGGSFHACAQLGRTRSSS